VFVESVVGQSQAALGAMTGTIVQVDPVRIVVRTLDDHLT